MNEHHTYTFAVLRYVHDITAGEFINVGVVLYAPKAKFLSCKTRTTFGRVTRLFPNADGEAFKRTMSAVETAVQRITKRICDDLFPIEAKSVIDIARTVVPHDDGSLQWSSVGSGRSHNLQRELEKLYERFVVKYDRQPGSQVRTDDEIWKSFSRALQARSVLSHFRDKEIVGDADSLTFRHAWKNGVWHCLEPVSFDLVDGRSIRDKACRWVGQMTALQGSSERFRLYLLVGEPKSADVQEHYIKALRILETMPGDKVIFTEAQTDEFSDVVVREILHHEGEQAHRSYEDA